MKENVANMLCNFGDLELREDYSGRGMFGETTFAVSGDDIEFYDALANSIEAIYADDYPNVEMWELTDLLRHIKTDSLGRGTIFY
jgi:hypothetical protein